MPTTDLQALYDLADQLLAVDDTSDQMITTLERTANRIDALRASGAVPPKPRVTPIRQTTPVQMKPRSAPVVTIGHDERPLHGGETALVPTIAAGVADAFRGGEGRRVLATLHATKDRPTLGRDATENETIVASARTALTASGGVCHPVPIQYEQRLVVSTRRPVRDGLTGFLANRGGIRFFFPPDFHSNDASAGVGEWTYATDVTPNGATKPYLTLPCDDDEQLVRLNAITQSMRLGNLAMRFEPERVQAWLDVLAAEHAALAEQRLLAQMVAGSKAISVGQMLGASRDVMAALDRVGSMFRNRHRMEPTATLRMIAPAYLRDMIRADLAREKPGASTERLAVVDAQITEMLAARHVQAIWSLDYQRVDATQGVGPAIGWPSVPIDVLLFAPGSWLFLDGGTLDIGVMRDLDLVKTNEAVTFMESFENAAFIGGPNESLRLRLDLCVNGGYPSALDIAPCHTDS